MFKKAKKGSRRLKKVKKAQVDSIWFKNKQKDFGMFKKIWEFQEGSSRFKKVQKGSRRFKMAQTGSRRFKKVQVGSRRFKLVEEG